MALTEQVLGIVAQADLIGEMNMFQRPAAYEQLVKNDIVPVLLAVAKHIDGASQSDETAAQIAELKQEIATLKGRVTKLQKSGSGVAA
ncbi:hypothetical protein [Rheinheimera sp.]|uniref:hypothetical protein n=1 Tax=Rheinheimera sp. TaxID=1869214 RepID=UPI003D290196